MNQQYYQTMFSANTGIAYQYVGPAVHEDNVTEIATCSLIDAMGSSECSIVVVQSREKIVVYTNNTTTITSDDFVMLANLEPEKVDTVVSEGSIV